MRVALFFIFMLFATSSYAGTAIVQASGVDDRVEIYIDESLESTCEWDGSNASCGVKIKNASGRTKIRIKLINYVYAGPCLLGGCGKYSGDFRISLNGDGLWTDSVYVRDNSPGLKYDTVIICDFSSEKCFEE